MVPVFLWIGVRRSHYRLFICAAARPRASAIAARSAASNAAASARFGSGSRRAARAQMFRGAGAFEHLGIQMRVMP
jgi:hypothetical protein